MSRTLNVYYAGDLFNHKQLVGTALVADSIRTLSGGKYNPTLPQDFTPGKNDLRNRILAELFSSDALIFNFDGGMIDPGTVAAFIYAKLLDIPAVLLRTDLPPTAQPDDTDPWTVMCEGYPRCGSIFFDAHVMYQRYRKPERNCMDSVRLFSEDIAAKIIQKLDDAIHQPSLYNGNNPQAVQTYDWAVKSCGFGLDKILTPTRIAEIVERKLDAGLI